MDVGLNELNLVLVERALDSVLTYNWFDIQENFTTCQLSPQTHPVVVTCIGWQAAHVEDNVHCAHAAMEQRFHHRRFPRKTSVVHLVKST